MIEFVEYISIPVRVKARIEMPKSPYTGGIGNMGIENIEICLRNDDTKLAYTIQELTDSIFEEDEDLFIERAYEHR